MVRDWFPQTYIIKLLNSTISISRFDLKKSFLLCAQLNRKKPHYNRISNSLENIYEKRAKSSSFGLQETCSVYPSLLISVVLCNVCKTMCARLIIKAQFGILSFDCILHQKVVGAFHYHLH